MRRDYENEKLLLFIVESVEGRQMLCMERGSISTNLKEEIERKL